MNQTLCLPALPRLNDICSGGLHDAQTLGFRCRSVKSHASSGMSHGIRSQAIQCSVPGMTAEYGPCVTAFGKNLRVLPRINAVLSGGMHENRCISHAVGRISQDKLSGVAYTPSVLGCRTRPVLTRCRVGASVRSSVPECPVSNCGSLVESWGVVVVDGDAPNVRVKSLKQGRRAPDAYYAGIGI